MLKRVRELIILHGEHPPGDGNGETKEVEKYLKQWPYLVIVDQVLCRHAPVSPELWLDPSQPEYSLQRLVPTCIRRDIFSALHNREASHMGYRKVYPLVQSRFFWAGMSVDVQDWLRSCLKCQQFKPGPGPGRLPLRQEIAS